MYYLLFIYICLQNEALVNIFNCGCSVVVIMMMMMMMFCSRQSVDAQFDDAAHSIMLFGLADDVMTVEKLVQSKYVEAVCYDTLDLQLPGIVVMKLCGCTDELLLDNYCQPVKFVM